MLKIWKSQDMIKKIKRSYNFTTLVDVLVYLSFPKEVSFSIFPY